MKTNLYKLQILIWSLAVAGVVSCKNNAKYIPPPAQTEYGQPKVQALTFSKPKKIDWAAIPDVHVTPDVKKFDFNKLPVISYDTTDLKPFSKPVVETKFDYNSLPEKDLDINTLPSRPLKFKTYILPLPKPINIQLPILRNADISLFELEMNQVAEGLFIACLFTDHSGFLWISTDNGLYRYDGDSLVLYVPGSLNSMVLNMWKDAAGRLWMTEFQGGLQILDIRAGTLRRTYQSDGLTGNNMDNILVDKQHRIWAPSYNPGGVNIIDPKTETVKIFDKTHGLSDSSGSDGIVEDKNDNIWIATGNGLVDINPKKKEIRYLDKPHGLGSNALGRLLLDRKGRLWAALPDGVIDVIDPQKRTIQRLAETQLPGNFIFKLIQDNKGRIWIGTNKTGVEIIDPDKHLSKRITTKTGLNRNSVLSICQDKTGQVWLGTFGAGLNEIGGSPIIKQHTGTKAITSVTEDAHGLIWQANSYGGVDIVDRKNKIVKHLGSAQGLGNDTLQNIAQVNNTIFIDNNAGLDIIDPTRTTITHLRPQQGLIDKNIASATVDQQGRVWLSSDKGIDIYDPQNNTIKHIGKAQHLREGFIDDLEKDQQGRIWAGNNTTGTVDVIDPASGTIQYLNNVGEFKNNVPTVMLAGSNGNMHIGNYNGIYIADMQNHQLITFPALQALLKGNIISLHHRNGSVYAGTSHGIFVITPPAHNQSGSGKWHVRSFGHSYGVNKLNKGYFMTDYLSSDGLYLWGDNGLTVYDLSWKDTSQTTAYVSGIRVMDQQKYFADQPSLKRGDTLWRLDDSYFKDAVMPVYQNNAQYSGPKWDSIAGPYNIPLNLHLPYDQNFLQFQFGSLNLGRRDSSRYRYILAGVDDKWSNITPDPGSRNYYNLRAGAYTFEVTAQNRDGSWGKPDLFSFYINPPWWQTWWAYIIYVLLFAGSIWAFAYYRSLSLIKEKRILEHKVHLRTEEVLQQKEEIEAQRDELSKTVDNLKITQRQLIQSEKMASLGELTAGIAHEIQNPLNFVNNFSEVNAELIGEMKQEIENGDLEEIKAIAADIEENSKKISMHGKRADAIVKGMLQHSQAGSGTKELTNVNALAEDFFKLSYHGLKAKDKSFNAEMVTHFDKDLPKASIVVQDIGRVLLNLFNNAFYAVLQKQKIAGDDYKPEVSVTTHAANGAITIKVNDNGTGIPGAIKDKIMQPFFTTKPTGQGTGLGLSLSYDIIKAHGGGLKMETVEGEFAEFSIIIPAD